MVIGLARADDELRQVPIVVCTADIVQSGDRLDELSKTGNIHVLQKPFGSEDLEALMGPLLAEGESDRAALASRMTGATSLLSACSCSAR